MARNRKEAGERSAASPSRREIEVRGTATVIPGTRRTPVPQLTPLQERFVAAYTGEDGPADCVGNATQSLIHAGYEGTSVYSRSYAIMQSPAVRAAIQMHWRKTMRTLRVHSAHQLRKLITDSLTPARERIMAIKLVAEEIARLDELEARQGGGGGLRPDEMTDEQLQQYRNSLIAPGSDDGVEILPPDTEEDQ